MSDIVFGVRLKADRSGFSSEFAGAGQDLRRFEADAGRATAGAEHLTRGLGGVVRAAAGLAGITLGAGLIREFVAGADAVGQLDARLRLATTSAAEFADVRERLTRIALDNNAGLQETVTLYTKLAPAVREAGGGVRETTAIVDAFAKTLRLSGASSAEAAASTLQFAQAMGSGKLSGDEFRSISETNIRLMQALATSLGVPVGKLKEMAAEGKLTADVVGNGLIKSLDQMKSEAATLPTTVGQAFTNLQTEVLQAVDRINKDADITSGIVAGIDALRDRVPELAGDLAGAAKLIAENMDVAAFAVGSKLALSLGQAAGEAKKTAVEKLNLARATLVAKVEYDALGVAITRTTAAQNTSAVASRTASAVLAGLGGPLGALVTVLGIASAAWLSFGDAAKDGAQDSADSVDKALANARRLREEARVGAGTMGDQIRALEQIKARLDEINKIQRLSPYVFVQEEKALVAQAQEIAHSIGLINAQAAQTSASVSALTNAAGANSKEAEKQAAAYAKLRNELAGLDPNFQKQLALLARLKPGTDEYRQAVEALIKQQPFAKDAAREQAKADEKAAKARDDATDAIDGYLRKIEDEARAAEAEVAAHGKSRSAIEATTIARLKEQRVIALLADDAEAVAIIEREIAARERLAAALASKDVLDANAKAAKAAGAEWVKIYDGVGGAITDAIFKGGADGWELLKRSIEATLIRAYVQPVMTQGVAALGQAIGLGPGPSAAGVASGSFGAVNAGGSALGVGSSIVGYGQAYSAGLAAAQGGTDLSAAIAAYNQAGYYGTALTLQSGQAAGGVGAGAQVSGLGVFGGAGAGALLGYQLGGGNPVGTFAGGAAGIAGYGAIAGAAAGSGAAAGAAAALSAVPVWGWVALAALALAGGMATGGTPHVGGAAFSTLGGDSGLATDANTPGFGLSWGAYRSTRGGDRSAAVDRSVAQVIGAAAGDTIGRAARYGGDASGLTLTGKFAADGEDKSRGGYLVTGAGGEQLFRFDKSSYSKDPKKGFEQFGGDSVRAEIAALQATDLDDWFDDILGAVDPLTDSLDVLNQALQLADEVAAQAAIAQQIQALGERDALEDARIAGLSATSAWFESSERIRQAAADGSLSVAQMAELAAQHYANEVRLLQRIAQASANIAAGYDDSRRNVELAGLSSPQQYGYIDKEIARYMDVLKGLTDADEIERYGQLIRRDLDQAFGLLSPEQQLKYKDQFLKRYDDAEQLTQDRLDVVEKKVLDEGETLFADLTDAADREITRITDAAVKVLNAARDAIPSGLDIRVTVDSPVPATAQIGYIGGDGP